MTQRADRHSRCVRGGGGAAAVAVLASALMLCADPTTAGADVATFSNPAAIAVPAAGSPNGIGPASPYPSAITVSGMMGTITDVNVTLTSVVHAIATDIDVLLVGPAGQSLIIMSDVKGD